VARGSSVEVTFRSANPRNNLRTEGTFLAVQLKDAAGAWNDVATDGHWETKFKWARHSSVYATSYATIVWDVPAAAVPGSYRIVHYGAHKEIITGTISEFTGTSSAFTVQ